jgi:hypothetical protein
LSTTIDPIVGKRKRSWRKRVATAAAILIGLSVVGGIPTVAHATENPTQDVTCDAISADYHRPLTNGDHINVTLDPPGGQVNVYVDQNIAGGASYNGQNNLGLRWNIFGAQWTTPLTLEQVLSGVITFNYGEAVKATGVNTWKVTFVQTNSTDTWPNLECGGETPPNPPEPPAVPEPTISYSEWQDGQWECGDTTVTQTRTVTTTPHKAVFRNEEWVIVDDTENISTSTETQTRPLTQSELESCEPVTPEPPAVPEPKVTYTDWQDGTWECGDTEVTQTRTKSTTTYEAVLKGKEWTIVEHTSTATESQTRPLTEAELKSCETTPVPLEVPEVFFHDSCGITDDSYSPQGEPVEGGSSFVTKDGVLLFNDFRVNGVGPVEAVFIPKNQEAVIPQPGPTDTYIVVDNTAVWRYTFTDEPCHTDTPTPPTDEPPTNPDTPDQPAPPQQGSNQLPAAPQSAGTPGVLASTGMELALPGGLVAALLAAGGLLLLLRRRIAHKAE